MRLFESGDIVKELETRYLGGDQSPGLLLQLAWCLRQSGSSEYLAEVQRCESVLTPLQSGRLALLHIERQFLNADIRGGLSKLDEWIARYGAIDSILSADGKLLQGLLLGLQGDAAGGSAAFAAAIASAQHARDAERVAFISATAANYEVSGDKKRWDQHWAERLKAPSVPQHPAVAAAIANCEGYAHGHRDDPIVAARLFQKAFEAQMETGQVANAITAACNIAQSLTVANDFDGGMEWAQTALDLARSRGWPLQLGGALRQVGACLQHIGHLDAAQSMLAESLIVLDPHRSTRTYSTLLVALGETALAAGRAEDAAHYFGELADRTRGTRQSDFHIIALQGMAAAFVHAGEWARADECIGNGLAIAVEQHLGVREITLRHLSARCRRAQGRTTEAQNELCAALAIAESLQSYHISPELLLELAHVYEDSGDVGRAFKLSLRAHEAREQLGLAQAERLATSMQIRIDTERARADAIQQRQRADFLQQATLTLEHLSAIGQEITAELDKERVFETIYRHVNGLLRAETFSIYLMNAEGDRLVSVFDIENGEMIPGDEVALSNSHSYSTRCVRERAELLIVFDDPDDDPNQLPGTLNTRSGLFAPLTIGQRVLGVMTIQSMHAQAYGDKERLIFRTLCAYAAIALDNAVAYGHLRETQIQLAAQERMAALGAMVAGVAHELNTPIGNAVLTTTTLQEHTAQLNAEVSTGNLRRSSLLNYLDDVDKALMLITRGLTNAASLVQSFKQVAVDRSTEQRRRFDLRGSTQDILATMAGNIAAAGHQIEVDIPDGIELDAYPGPYGQVLTNLINNSIFHGFSERTGGTMRLVVRALADKRIELTFSDDGAGISPEALKRVFDPFYTTRLGQGSSGLGLAISHTIATSLFGGQLSVSSTPGQGTRFVWVFPRVSPMQPGGVPQGLT